MRKPGNKRRRSIELLLQRKREKYRLSRIGVHYNPNKGLPEKRRVNPRFELQAPVRGNKHLVAPKELNVAENLVATLDFIKSIRSAAIYGEEVEVLIDLTDVKDISPAAALILFAELKRCVAYAGGRRLRGRWPSDSRVMKMLDDMGTFRMLNVKRPAQPRYDQHFFKIVSGTQSSGKVADGLIRQFERSGKFHSIARKRLFSALIECMDNVRLHAYDGESKSPHLMGEWWMAGYCDFANDRMAFLFYDQGVGIPTSIKTREEKTLMQRVIWSEHDRLRDAVMIGLSREASRRRGRGLPSLRAFIDELAADGYLRVLANHGDFKYEKSGAQTAAQLQRPLDGSLIIWVMQHRREVIGADAILPSQSNA